MQSQPRPFNPFWSSGLLFFRRLDGSGQPLQQAVHFLHLILTQRRPGSVKVAIGRIFGFLAQLLSLFRNHVLAVFFGNPTEASEFLKSSMSGEVITQGLAGFLEPEQFEARYPGQAPEKYLVVYHCKGLIKEGEDDFRESSQHALEVVYGWDYPNKKPTFVWGTPIWHPNIKTPYICLEERPFAIGLTLDRVVVEVGRMIQYQSYNVDDPLNQEAADWARKNRDRFPVDDRDLLDGTRRIGVQPGDDGDGLVKILSPGGVEMEEPGSLVELI